MTGIGGRRLESEIKTFVSPIDSGISSSFKLERPCLDAAVLSCSCKRGLIDKYHAVHTADVGILDLNPSLRILGGPHERIPTSQTHTIDIIKGMHC